MTIPKKKKWLVPTLVGVAGIAVVAIAAVLAFYFTNGTQTAEKYTKQISIADKYYENEEYELALEAYLSAIEEDQQNVEAYIGAAKTYRSLGRYEESQQILLQGYQTTGENKLKLMYKQYIAEGDKPKTDGDELQTEISFDINRELLGKLLNYTYEDYKREYGNVKVENKSSSLVKLSFGSFKGLVYYANDNIKTFDTTTGIPISGMKAEKVTLEDLSDLIVNFQDNMKFDSIQDLFGKNTEIKKDDNDEYYIYSEYNKCLIKIACTKDGMIKDKNAWNEIVSLMKVNDNANKGYLIGTVISAQDGKGIHNVSLSFREGKNQKTGRVEAENEIKTNSNGRYEIELNADIYTVQVKAEGYQEEFFEIELEKGETNVEGNFTLVPSLADGTVKIVLEWGAEPNDLDSHLDGMTSDGQALSISYSSTSFTRNGVEYANLDLDDTSSYGPETITLNDFNGTYTYSVVDFTNMNASSSVALSSSGATVKVYVGQSDPMYFTVPQGIGTVWEVFSIQGGNIVPINILH